MPVSRKSLNVQILELYVLKVGVWCVGSLFTQVHYNIMLCFCPLLCIILNVYCLLAGSEIWAAESEHHILHQTSNTRIKWRMDGNDNQFLNTIICYEKWILIWLVVWAICLANKCVWTRWIWTCTVGYKIVVFQKTIEFIQKELCLLVELILTYLLTRVYIQTIKVSQIINLITKIWL